MSDAKTTTDHTVIREWAEARGGHPATVAATGDGEAGILRIDFDPPDEGLKRITWNAFFEKFDKEKLVFLYQEKTKDGSISRFQKFVDRDTARKAS